MNNFLTAILLTISVPVLGQAKSDILDCNCPGNTSVGTTKGDKPDTTFTFSDGHYISICGSVENRGNETYISEFLLWVCGQDSVIAFSDATQQLRLAFLKDTIRLIEVKFLPVGPDRSFAQTDWGIEKIYFSNGQLVVNNYIEINQEIRKYTIEEITETLKEFEIAKTGNLRNPEELANRLFISAISGDGTARKNFAAFETQFGQLDGGLSEEYKALQAMLSAWTAYNFHSK